MKKKLAKQHLQNSHKEYKIPWCNSKKVKDLYDKNFKSLKKEIEEDLRRWKDLSCSWISSINIVKMAILLKAIYRLNSILIKTTTSELERQFANSSEINLG
jgi:hypothetical protein